MVAAAEAMVTTLTPIQTKLSIYPKIEPWKGFIITFHNKLIQSSLLLSIPELVSCFDRRRSNAASQVWLSERRSHVSSLARVPTNQPLQIFRFLSLSIHFFFRNRTRLDRWVCCSRTRSSSELVRQYGVMYSKNRIDTLDSLNSLPQLKHAHQLKAKILFSIIVVRFEVK